MPLISSIISAIGTHITSEQESRDDDNGHAGLLTPVC
jgi:hypothetical protein